MTTPEPADLSDVHEELGRLRAENEQLRKELGRRQTATRTRTVETLKFGGSIFLPMLDRQRVFRTFVAFFNEASFYTLPREYWPPREQVLERGRDFGLAMLRFFVKRRIIIILFSLLALMMPLVQVWLVFQQNAIIENQNKYFNIQVYDIVARSLTEGDTTAKKITSALLAREDFALINGIIKSVFESQPGGSYTEDGAVSGGAQKLFLKETAARGHLVSAMGHALERQGEGGNFDELWTQAQDTFGLVTTDATDRVRQLLLTKRASAFDEPIIGQECFRYLFSLSYFLRQSYALSLAAGGEAAYFKGVAPLVASLSKVVLPADAPFKNVFVLAFNELLFEIPQKPEFGKPLPEVDGQAVERMLQDGFRTIVDRSQAAGAAVDEGSLKRLLEVP